MPFLSYLDADNVTYSLINVSFPSFVSPELQTTRGLSPPDWVFLPLIDVVFLNHC